MSSNIKKRSALGKGLSALLENAATDITSKTPQHTGTLGSVSLISLDMIEVNPFNPRTEFDAEALEELKESILLHGIIQPLTVRKLGRDKYQLISGERRFRASQLAGLTEVPAYIRLANDQAMLALAIVENIQRKDLNAIEEALGYQQLIEECKLTQDELSKQVSKSRSVITNYLRLLKLPVEVQMGVRKNVISMGHARALVSAGTEIEQLEIFERILTENLSVREVEQLVKGNDPRPTKTIGTSNTPPSSIVSAQERTFQAHLSDKLATKIEIKKGNSGGGKLSIVFNSESDLHRIITLLNK
jgi:ParB family chromosome partitioning protein